MRHLLQSILSCVTAVLAKHSLKKIIILLLTNAAVGQMECAVQFYEVLYA